MRREYHGAFLYETIHYVPMLLRSDLTHIPNTAVRKSEFLRQVIKRPGKIRKLFVRYIGVTNLNCMKSLITVCAAMLMLEQCPKLFGQSKKLPGARQELIDIEHKWVKSYLTRDTVFLKSLFDNEAKFISTHGELTTSKTEIGEVSKNTIKYNAFETTDVDPVIYGNTAVVTNQSHINATIIASGKTVDLHVRALDVFVKKNGRWQVVASQITRTDMK